MITPKQRTRPRELNETESLNPRKKIKLSSTVTPTQTQIDTQSSTLLNSEATSIDLNLNKEKNKSDIDNDEIYPLNDITNQNNEKENNEIEHSENNEQKNEEHSESDSFEENREDPDNLSNNDINSQLQTVNVKKYNKRDINNTIKQPKIKKKSRRTKRKSKNRTKSTTKKKINKQSLKSTLEKLNNTKFNYEANIKLSSIEISEKYNLKNTPNEIKETLNELQKNGDNDAFAKIIYFARKTGICHKETQADFEKNVLNKNNNFISNIKFNKDELISYPKLSTLQFGKMAKAYSMMYNDAPISITASAMLTFLAMACRGLRIYVTQRRFIYPNLFIATIGAPGTTKSPIMKYTQQIWDEGIRKHAKLLNKHCGVYSYPLTQILSESAGSFGAFMQKAQFTMDMSAYYCDEISAANKTFQLDTKSSEAAGSLCTAYDNKRISRNFMDSQFESEIEHPYWNINIVTQAGPLKNYFKKWIQTGAAQRFVYHWGMIDGGQYVSNRKSINTSGIKSQDENIFTDMTKHWTSRALVFFSENLLNDLDRHSIVFDNPCEFILSVFDLTLTKYVLDLKKYSDNKCDIDYVRGLFQKARNHTAKYAALLYMYEEFYNDKPITCLNDEYFIEKMIPKAISKEPIVFIIDDPNIIIGAIELSLKSVIAFCWLFDFPMVHIRFNVITIITEKLYPILQKNLEEARIKLKSAKKNKFLNYKEENDELNESLDIMNDTQSHNITHNNIELKEDEEIDDIEINCNDILIGNKNNNHNKNNPKNDYIHDNDNHNHNNHLDFIPTSNTDDEESDNEFNQKQISMKYEEMENLIGLILTLPGKIINITNIKTRPSFKSSFSLKDNHYNKILELINNELKIDGKQHLLIRNHIINILIFLSKKGFGFITKTDFTGSTHLYYKPCLTGLTRWLKRDTITDYDLNSEDDKYKTKSLLSFLARCRLSVSTFIKYAELPNRFIERKNSGKTIMMPEYWDFKKAKENKIEPAIDDNLLKDIEMSILSIQINFESICISMENNLKNNGSKYNKYYVIKSNLNSTSSKKSTCTSKQNKKSMDLEVDDISKSIKYIDNDNNMFRKGLNYLPTLIDDSLKSDIGKKCLKILKEIKTLKNEYFNQLRHPNVLRNLCDSEIPVDALIPTKNYHRLQSIGSFENLKWKKYVEQYRQRYNITGDEYDMINNFNDANE